MAQRQQMTPGDRLTNILRGLGLLTDNPALCEDIKRKFAFDPFQTPGTIPYATYLAVLKYIHTSQYADLPAEVMYEKFGRAAISGYYSGPTGAIMRMMTPIISDKAAVVVLLKSFRESTPFGEHEAIVERPGLIYYNRKNVPVPPEFVRGMLLELLSVARTNNPRVKYVEHGPLDITYTIEWDV